MLLTFSVILDTVGSMEKSSDYKGNILAITDAQVSKDWRLGMLRATALFALDYFSFGEVRIFGVELSGNDGHVESCEISEVFDIVENSAVVWDRGYDTAVEREVQKLRAVVSCGCGEIDKVSVVAQVEIGDFMNSIMSV